MGLFMDSQSLVGDGASLDLAMDLDGVGVWRKPLAWATKGNSKDGSLFSIFFRVLSSKFLG
jgi:hypothetical protein